MSWKYNKIKFFLFLFKFSRALFPFLLKITHIVEGAKLTNSIFSFFLLGKLSQPSDIFFLLLQRLCYFSPYTHPIITLSFPSHILPLLQKVKVVFEKYHVTLLYSLALYTISLRFTLSLYHLNASAFLTEPRW